MFARYYNSATGRFLSPDWSVKEEPVPYAKLDDPQSLNLYSYVGNNPVAREDVDGHCYPWCTAALGAAVFAGAEVFNEWREGKGYSKGKIGAAIAGGAVFGVVGPVGDAIGAGVVGTVGWAAYGGVLGGATEKIVGSAVSGKDETPYPVTKKEVGVNAALGAVGAVVDSKVAKVAVSAAGKVVATTASDLIQETTHRRVESTIEHAKEHSKAKAAPKCDASSSGCGSNK